MEYGLRINVYPVGCALKSLRFMKRYNNLKYLVGATKGGGQLPPVPPPGSATVKYLQQEGPVRDCVALSRRRQSR